MSTYLGDFHSGCTVAGAFTTVTTTGAPTALTGTANSACLVAYKLLAGDATGFVCSTAGLTLARDCAGATGFNTYSVNTNSDLTFYSCGRDYALIMRNGTVGGTCVSGYTIATFSLNNRSHLRPSVHGRTLNVTAKGAANVNWAGVENCTNATTLSCTTAYSVVKVVDRPIVDACSTIFSVQKVIDRPFVDACSTVFSVTSVTNDVAVGTNRDKTGYALSAAGIACVTTAPIHEPANVPGWPMSLCTVLGWLGAVASNKIVQEAGQQGVCTRDGATLIAQADTTDDGTSATRGSFT